jgi:hypothetical protein
MYSTNMMQLKKINKQEDLHEEMNPNVAIVD